MRMVKGMKKMGFFKHTGFFCPVHVWHSFNRSAIRKQLLARKQFQAARF